MRIVVKYSLSTHTYILWSYRIYIGKWSTGYEIEYISRDAHFFHLLRYVPMSYISPWWRPLTSLSPMLTLWLTWEEAVVCCWNSLQIQEHPHCTQAISWLLMVLWRKEPGHQQLAHVINIHVLWWCRNYCYVYINAIVRNCSSWGAFCCWWNDKRLLSS